MIHEFLKHILMENLILTSDPGFRILEFGQFHCGHDIKLQ